MQARVLQLEKQVEELSKNLVTWTCTPVTPMETVLSNALAKLLNVAECYINYTEAGKEEHAVLEEAQRALTGFYDHLQTAVPEEADGNILPKIGSRIGIKQASTGDRIIPVYVTGYYVWPSLDENSIEFRVFVRVVYEDGSTTNARMLNDIYPV